MDIEIELSEKEHEGRVLFQGVIRYKLAGKGWQAGISGLGTDRKDAVAAAIANPEKLIGLKAAILSVLAEKYPDSVPVGHGSPKAESRPAVLEPKAEAATSVPGKPAAETKPEKSMARKGGWPKGKPRKPRSEIPSQTNSKDGAQSEPLTGKSPSQSEPVKSPSSGEPF